MLPTVKIIAEKSDFNPGGFVVINESDFDEKTMKLFEEPAEVPQEEKLRPTLSLKK